MGRIIYFHFIIIALACSGQTIAPVQFDQFYQNQILINPASAGKESNINILAGHKLLTSIFEGVNTTYSGASLRLNRKDSLSSSHHGVGLFFVNNREGHYFNRGRLQGLYAYHLTLAKNWNASTGISLGIVDHSFKGTDLYPARSEVRPTADVGFLVYRERSSALGLTFGQLIPSSMNPLEPGRKIHPYFQSTIEQRLYTYGLVHLNTAVSYRSVKETRNNLDVSLLLKIQDQITLGVLYKWQRGYALSGGLKAITSAKTAFDLYASWYVPSVKTNLNINVLELTSNFYFR